MKRLMIAAAAVALCHTANAGIYSDDMARCLVASTSQKDKTALVRWVFANASLHPDVASISSVTPEARDALDREVATLLERLLTDSCRKQSSEAFKYEGAIAFQQSFGTLGQVAMHELMADRNVAASFQSFVKYLDKTKLQSIGIEQ